MFKRQTALAFATVFSLAAFGTPSQVRTPRQTQGSPQDAAFKQQCILSAADAAKLRMYAEDCSLPQGESDRYMERYSRIKASFHAQNCRSVVSADEIVPLLRSEFDRFGETPKQYCPALKNHMPQIEQRYRNR